MLDQGGHTRRLFSVETPLQASLVQGHESALHRLETAQQNQAWEPGGVAVDLLGDVSGLKAVLKAVV
jgi:hypothetical protein